MRAAPVWAAGALLAGTAWVPLAAMPPIPPDVTPRFVELVDGTPARRTCGGFVLEGVAVDRNTVAYLFRKGAQSCRIRMGDAEDTSAALPAFHLTCEQAVGGAEQSLLSEFESMVTKGDRLRTLVDQLDSRRPEPGKPAALAHLLRLLKRHAATLRSVRTAPPAWAVAAAFGLVVAGWIAWRAREGGFTGGTLSSLAGGLGLSTLSFLLVRPLLETELVAGSTPAAVAIFGGWVALAAYHDAVRLISGSHWAAWTGTVLLALQPSFVSLGSHGGTCLLGATMAFAAFGGASSAREPRDLEGRGLAVGSAFLAGCVFGGLLLGGAAGLVAAAGLRGQAGPSGSRWTQAPWRHTVVGAGSLAAVLLVVWNAGSSLGNVDGVDADGVPMRIGEGLKAVSWTTALLAGLGLAVLARRRDWGLIAGAVAAACGFGLVALLPSSGHGQLLRDAAPLLVAGHVVVGLGLGRLETEAVGLGLSRSGVALAVVGLVAHYHLLARWVF